jgi:hypothetical protein
MHNKRWPATLLGIGWLVVLIIGANLVGAQDGAECRATVLERDMQVVVVPAIGAQVRALPAGEAFDVLPGGSIHRVLDWPVCRDGLLWWQVRYVRDDAWTAQGPARLERVGWVAEYAPNGDPILLSQAVYELTRTPTDTPLPSATTASTVTPSPTSTGTVTPSATITNTSSPTSGPTLDPTIWSEPFTVWR